MSDQPDVDIHDAVILPFPTPTPDEVLFSDVATSVLKMLDETGFKVDGPDRPMPAGTVADVLSGVDPTILDAPTVPTHRHLGMLLGRAGYDLVNPEHGGELGREARVVAYGAKRGLSWLGALEALMQTHTDAPSLEHAGEQDTQHRPDGQAPDHRAPDHQAGTLPQTHADLDIPTYDTPTHDEAHNLLTTWAARTRLVKADHFTKVTNVRLQRVIRYSAHTMTDTKHTRDHTGDGWRTLSTIPDLSLPDPHDASKARTADSLVPGSVHEERCPDCAGRGKNRHDVCDGNGKYPCKPVQQCTSCTGTRHYGPDACHTCKGRGIIDCKKCRGTGWARCGGCRGTGNIGCRTCKERGTATWYHTQHISRTVKSSPTMDSHDIDVELRAGDFTETQYLIPAALPTGLGTDDENVAHTVAEALAALHPEQATWTATAWQHTRAVEVTYETNGQPATAWLIGNQPDPRVVAPAATRTRDRARRTLRWLITLTLAALVVWFIFLR